MNVARLLRLGGLKNSSDGVCYHDGDGEKRLRYFGKGRGLMGNSLFDTSITGNNPGVMLNQIGAKGCTQKSLREGHANAIGDSLTERSGRYLNRRSHPNLGVAWSSAVGLPEFQKVFSGNPVAENTCDSVLQN